MAVDETIVREYQDNGYVVLPGFFDGDSIAELRRVVDDFVEVAAKLDQSDANFDVITETGSPSAVVRRIKNPDAMHASFRAFARDPKIVELLQALLGADVRLEVGKINFKPAGGHAAIAWHQDYPFSPLTNDDSAAVGIFIDDVTPENGPLMVVPGSHRQAILDHHSDGCFVGRIDTANHPIDPAETATVVGPAGSISVHHCRTLHSSGPNHSDAERRIYFNQYHAVDAWPLLGVPDLDWWTERRLSGDECFRPRVTLLDVKLPLPAADYGSIFELQARADDNRSAAEKNKNILEKNL